MFTQITSIIVLLLILAGMLYLKSLMRRRLRQTVYEASREIGLSPSPDRPKYDVDIYIGKLEGVNVHVLVGWEYSATPDDIKRVPWNRVTIMAEFPKPINFYLKIARRIYSKKPPKMIYPDEAFSKECEVATDNEQLTKAFLSLGILRKKIIDFIKSGNGFAEIGNSRATIRIIKRDIPTIQKAVYDVTNIARTFSEMYIF